MPATSKATPKEQAALKKMDSNTPRFVRCELTVAQKDNLPEWAMAVGQEALLEWLTGRVTSGHTISIRCNDVGFQCSVTGAYEGSGHQGMSLVARASTPMKALYSAFYRDDYVLEGKWVVLDRLQELDF